MEFVLPLCPVHVVLQQVFYCLECDELLCRKCMMDNHRLHNYDETEVVAHQKSVAVSDVLVPASQTLTDNQEMTNFAGRKESLASYHLDLKASLKSKFDKIRKHLDDREAYLLSCLQKVVEKQHVKIEDVEKDFVQLSLKLQNTIVDAKKLVEEPRSISTITEGRRILSDLEKLTNQLTSLCVPFTENKKCVQLVFEDEKTVKNAIDKLGVLVDENKFPLQADYLASMHTKSHRLSRNTSLPVLSSAGEDAESDSGVTIVQPTAIISCTEKGKKFYPCGIAVGSNNLITVSDLRNNLVKVLTSTGKVIDTIESTKGCYAFRGPCALHVNEGNDIFILEQDSKTIRKYTNGSLLDLGKFSKQFDDPRGIMVLMDKVYVTDWKNNCIHILTLANNKLVYQSSVGERYLKQPTGIACNTVHKAIVVSDQENHCAWVLTPEGEVMNAIGAEKGSHLGKLSGPYGVAVTADGKVVISERGDSRISVYSLEGTRIFSFGCRGSDPGHFNQPRHVCANSNNQILVADEMNQRVQIFDI